VERWLHAVGRLGQGGGVAWPGEGGVTWVAATWGGRGGAVVVEGRDAAGVGGGWAEASELGFAVNKFGGGKKKNKELEGFMLSWIGETRERWWGEKKRIRERKNDRSTFKKRKGMNSTLANKWEKTYHCRCKYRFKRNVQL
jgi:hypothetical protein